MASYENWRGWTTKIRERHTFYCIPICIFWLCITCNQFSSVIQSWLTLYDPTDCSMPGFSVCHQLPELTQTQVYRVGDALQPSHPLSSPSPPAFNLSHHHSGNGEKIWNYLPDLRSLLNARRCSLEYVFDPDLTPFFPF